MLAEIIPDAYDINGKRILHLPQKEKRRIFQPTFPIRQFIATPLESHCSSLADIRQFLRGCIYVSDQEQFGKDDYWMLPSEFEKKRKGDCEDFSIWTWRQLMNLNIPCRFVVGLSGRYGEGHAWLTMEQDGKQYLVESLACLLPGQLPRLSTVRYRPMFSVEWDGEKISYFKHEKMIYDPSFAEAVPLLLEWVNYWFKIFGKILWALIRLPYLILRKLHKKEQPAA